MTHDHTPPALTAQWDDEQIAKALRGDRASDSWVMPGADGRIVDANHALVVAKQVRDDLSATIARLTGELAASESLVAATEAANKRDADDARLDLQDLERLTELEAENERLQAQLRHAATYTGIEGYACPLCLYENGKFIQRCEMHRQMDEMQVELAAARAGRWWPVEDGIVQERKGVIMRVMDEGERIWQRDTIFDMDDKVFLPEHMRLCKWHEGEPGQPPGGVPVPDAVRFAIEDALSTQRRTFAAMQLPRIKEPKLEQIDAACEWLDSLTRGEGA